MSEMRVIDVSVYQGDIDWATVKNHIDGAIIRCGYGQDLEKQDDTKFVRNVEACIKYGIPFGVYLYSYAKTAELARGEAAHVLRLLEPYKGRLSFPVYYDLEEAGTESTAVQRAIVFGDIIEAAGYWCGIYANQNWWRNYLKDGLNRFTKWVAKYSSSKPTGISGTYDMWQYSSKGSVPGIKGNVDMNYCYRDFPSQIRKASGKEEESGQEKAPGQESVPEEETTAAEDGGLVIHAYSKAKDGSRALSANFKVKEFACSDGTDPIFLAPKLVEVLQKIRDHFGKAVVINSGFRTAARNKAVGGAAYSQHLYGTAADIAVNGIAPGLVADYAETLLADTGGIGRYSSFTHVDVREEKARWNG